MFQVGGSLERMLLIALVQLFGVLLALVGCGSPSQPPSIVGNWTGTVTDSSGHTGSANRRASWVGAISSALYCD